ncbi:MAG: Type I restriction-modification system, M subunit [Candidatus Uhrbacteria bacterium GW2011_GWF2_39_13]|uniref:site-specific DNA-methyltransferase (adenine-specific) n=1 Tax=Candidatus Uhrbacteria bacterium GW2011_GWF2_39_13 TaxID=1618995 RepID=A0A0G0MJA7_9BACT|nr:MAG: Type I restriction-modification system, M subunit [Candidatus Uhrbacteria bacterium GW2011_GWF2_39_13]
MNNMEIVNKLWNLCNVLRDDGIIFHQYVIELTYILFIKMAKETNAESKIPKQYRWDNLVAVDTDMLLSFYNELLKYLGKSGKGIIQKIYADAKTDISETKNLKKIITEIDKLDWYSAKSEGLGDIYEGLLEKNANEKKSGAGQYFTPRPLVEVMVRVCQPKLGEKINDPACGTFGFMIAADQYLRKNYNNYKKLSSRELKFQIEEAFSGCELVKDTHRLALMNATLHGMECKITLGDTLSPVGETMKGYDLVLTNPPFGTKSGGERAMRRDLPFPGANKQLNFLQHVYLSLNEENTSRAAVVVPDNVLFQDGDGQKVRNELMDNFNLDAILRLPTGIFYAQGVKTNVLFFNRQEKNTDEVWFYDMRSNMQSFGKRNPLTEEHFSDFEQEYERRKYSVEDFDSAIEALTSKDRKTIVDKRFSCISREEIKNHGDSLDLGLIMDETMSTPSPEELAQEAAAELSAAMDSINKIVNILKFN